MLLPAQLALRCERRRWAAQIPRDVRRGLVACDANADATLAHTRSSGLACIVVQREEHSIADTVSTVLCRRRLHQPHQFQYFALPEARLLNFAVLLAWRSCWRAAHPAEIFGFCSAVRQAATFVDRLSLDGHKEIDSHQIFLQGTQGCYLGAVLARGQSVLQFAASKLNHLSTC
eukprot:2864939-Pleurochrysis_carterae.AAC.5